MELLHSSEERLHVVIPEQIRVANESLEAIRGEVKNFALYVMKRINQLAGATRRN